jgi:hypothetical protein
MSRIPLCSSERIGALSAALSITLIASVSAAAEPAPAPPSQAEESSITFRAPRARTMEELSEASTQELHLGASRARYSLNFFGDVSAFAGSPMAPDLYPSFAIGAQDLLLRGELGSHIVAQTEIAIEAHPEGVVLDVERYHVRWQWEPFFIEAGRVHTVFGYWNNAYHHGRWLQPSIDRPRWVAFEDDHGILPVHWVGLDVGAKVKTASGTWNVVASIGNGRGKIVDDVRTTGDYQSMKAFHGSVEYVGLFLPDLHIGVSGIFDRIPPQPAAIRPALPDVFIDESIVGAHIAYPSVPLILIAEGYFIEHLQGSQRWETFGGFALLGYAFGSFVPYVRAERIASAGGLDPFFVPDPAAQGVDSFDTVDALAGLRFDLTDFTALKAEYQYTKAFDTSQVTHLGTINWSWGF